MVPRFAKNHNKSQLLDAALHFIQVHFPQVSQEEEFLDLPKEQLVNLLKSEKIYIDTEFQVRIGQIAFYRDVALKEAKKTSFLSSGLPSSLQLDQARHSSETLSRV